MAFTREVRRKIFYALVGLFCIVGLSVVFYAQGLRINFATGRTETVGAIFVRSFPEDAAISLNNQPIPNRTGFLSQGTFITNLDPGTYSLALKKDGYLDWQESAAVSSSLITEFKYAVLVPKNATTVVDLRNTADYFESGGDVVTEADTGVILAAAKTVANGQIVDHAGVKSMIVRMPGGNYRFYDLARGASANLSNIISGAGVNPQGLAEIMIDPSDPGTVLAETGTRILSISPALRAATIIATTSPAEPFTPGLAVSSGFIAWANKFPGGATSSVNIYDRFLGNAATQPVPIPGTIRTLRWIGPAALGILTDDGALYRYDIASSAPQKLAAGVATFSAADDGTAVAARENGAIQVFSFANDLSYRFVLQNAADIQNLIWYKDDNHLFVVYPDHVSFLDFTDAGLKNFAAAAQGSSPEYDPQMNALYIIAENGTIARYDFPQ